jgi:hypothetical protein
VSITGDIDLRVLVNPSTLATGSSVISKLASGGGAYLLRLATTSIIFDHWDSGGTQRSATIAGAALTGVLQWVRVTMAVATGARTAYTSPDGVTWTQYGSTSTLGATSIRDTTDIIEVGSRSNGVAELVTGIIYRAQIYSGIAGTLVFDANFTGAAKLATSFTESSSNAATVTINTTGALGARICGARDLVQMTVANQPVLTIASGGNYLTFDGSNDYLKAASFSLSQPESVYFTGSQVAWGANLALCDGNTFDTLRIVQSDASTDLRIRCGSSEPAGTEIQLPLGTRGVLTAIYNTTASSLRLNNGAVNVGTVGAATPSGFTLASRDDGAGPSNITVSEIIIRSAADSTPLQSRIASYLIRKWRITP